MEQLLQTRATAGRRRTLAASAAFAFLAPMLFFPARGSAEQADPAGDLPLTFVPNAGQTDDSVRYVARGAGYSFFFADEQAVLSLMKTDGQDVSGLALDLRFIGASPTRTLEAREPTSATVSQLTGSTADSASQETYKELVYRELWPGIDMVFRADGGELKYEFQLDPSADPGDIRLDYDGVFDRGYNNTDVFVTKLDRSGSTIAYSTFIGESAFDSGNGIAVDDPGRPVAGFSGSLNYPTTAGAFDTSQGRRQ